MGKVKDYQYTLLSQIIDVKNNCNIYGVVASIKPQPTSTELVLQDESGSVKVTINSSAELLRDCAVKDVLRIHRAWPSLKHEVVIDLHIGRGGTHVILFNSEQPSEKERVKYSSSPNFTMTQCDKNRIKALRTFAKTISNHFPDPAIEMRREGMLHYALCRLKEHPRPLPPHIYSSKSYEEFMKFKVFKSLREMSSSQKDCPAKSFFSCFTQIISVQTTLRDDCVVLTVWDGTELSFARNPGRILPSELREICSTGGTLVSEAVAKMSVDVFCFGSKNCDLCRTLKFGDVVLLGVAGFITHNGRMVLALQADGSYLLQRGDLAKVPDESEFGLKCRNSCNEKLDSLLTLDHPREEPRSILKRPTRSASHDSFLDGLSTHRDLGNVTAPKKAVSFARKTVPPSPVSSSVIQKLNPPPVIPKNNALSLFDVTVKQRSNDIDCNKINIKREVNETGSEDDSVFARPFVPQPRIVAQAPPNPVNVKREPLSPLLEHIEDMNVIAPSHASNSINQSSEPLPTPMLTNVHGAPLPIVKIEPVASPNKCMEQQPAVSLSATVKREPSSLENSFVLLPPSVHSPSSFTIRNNCSTNTVCLERPRQQILMSLPINIKREMEDAASEEDSVFACPFVPPPRKSSRLAKVHQDADAVASVSNSSATGRKRIDDRKRKSSDENICPLTSRNGIVDVNRSTSAVAKSVSTSYDKPGPSSSSTTSLPQRSASNLVVAPRRRSILKQPQRSLSHDSFIDGPSTSRGDRRLSVPNKKVRFDTAFYSPQKSQKVQPDGCSKIVPQKLSAVDGLNENEIVPDSQEMPSTSGISLFDSRNPALSFLLHMVRWKTLAKSAEHVAPFEMSIDEEASRILQRVEGDEFLLINWFPINKEVWLRLFPKIGAKIVWTGYCPSCNSEPRLPSKSEDHRFCLVCRKAGQDRNTRIFKCKIVIPFKCADKYLLFYINIDEVLRGIGRASDENLCKFQQEENAEELINIAGSYEVQFNTATVNRKKPGAMHVFANNPHFRLRQM